MNQLKSRDLKGGDILLKLNDGSLTNKLIALGQRGELNAQIVHGGIMFDSNIIIESSGPGLIANDIRVQNKAKGYIVYRPTNNNLATGAATCAKMMFDIQGKNNSLKYNLIGTVKTKFGETGNAKSANEMDELCQRILTGKNTPMFCTQFVVYVFQWVASQSGISANSIFSINDAKATPSRLASILQGNSSFYEAGYMIGGER